MTGVPFWRIAAGVVVLAGLLIFAGAFAPIYLHNLQLQNFVSALAQRPPAETQSDDLVRTRVLDKAHQLELPVRPDNIKILRSGNGLRIDVRYFVRVTIPGYTVDLHFHPLASP